MATRSARPRATSATAGPTPKPVRATAKPARARRASAATPVADERNGHDPDGGHGELHDQLQAAVAETARLLEADGAMVYLLDETSGHLRFAHDAGIRNARTRDWVRTIRLPIGVGMFGRAVAERGVVTTGDYLTDPAIAHAPDTDRAVRDIGIRSMVAAPLVSGETVFGAIGAFSSRAEAFSPSQIALVRALADHAAAAMANTRLIEALDESRLEMTKRAEVERSLREIAARISAATDLPAVLQGAVNEAARLLEADGARIDLVDRTRNLLLGAYDASAVRPTEDVWPDDPEDTLEGGISGRTIITKGPAWTGNYLEDTSFKHGAGSDAYVRNVGIQSVMAAPLMGEGGPFGALTIFSNRPDAWGAADAQLLVAIADQAAITITTTRLIDESAAAREALGRRAAAEQALREIAARITILREPSEILQDVVKHAGNLVRADGVILDLLDPSTGNLHWALDDGLGKRFNAKERAKLWISVGVGATGMAVAEDRVVVADGDLVAQFPPSPESTRFYERTGFQSMIAAPITGDTGPLGVIEVYSKRPHAFTETDGNLVGALASQAAIAITNARLIDQLARSQDDLARTADAERTLREIAERVSAMHDQEAILQSVIDAAARLLQATGVTIDLIDRQGMAEAWIPGVHEGTTPSARLYNEIDVDPDAGISGLAITTRRAAWTGDYVKDRRFKHTRDRDTFVRQTGTHSVIAAPLMHRDELLGVINAYSDRRDAFDTADAGRLSALADQTAVAIANARLIEDLERSRAEIARRADSERTLREIAARVSAILEPAEVLQRIVAEAARLLDSDGARIDQYDPEIDALRWSYAAGDAMAHVPDWARTGGLKPGQAVAGLAFAEQRAILTTDYLTDERFDHQPEVDTFIRDAGIRAVMSTPLSGDAGPLGTISVVSRSPGAYDTSDLEVLTALATQASIAIRNARLMEELARSRAMIERRAEAEHALREIAARITAIREPGDLLQRIVDEALRLLRADGAVIDEFDSEGGVLISVYDAGLTDVQRQHVRATRQKLGQGLSGKAMAEGRVVRAGDYLAGDFEHTGESDLLALTTGIGDLIVAPIIGDDGPLGAIEVYSHDRHTFDAIDEAVLGGLADQAAIALTNAKLIEELERSRRAEAQRAETERSLRDITGRIAALREPDVILERVVEEAKRLLGTDGAHLTRMSEDGTYLVPVVVAGGADAETKAWLLGLELPIGGGINGLAAQERTTISTADYLLDERIPREPEDVEGALRMGLRGMAAAPLRAPGGDVIGTLAISSGEPRTFDAEELDLLQGLADQAAIAITNTTLLNRLTQSEERYRYLVENAPDLVWSVGADSRLTFLSDAVQRMTGRKADDLIGRHFGVLVHESSRDVTELDWTQGLAVGSQELRGRLNLLGHDGEPIPAEFIATARLDESGRFAGANGSVRDMRDQDRLERELQESEQRFRQLVQTTPDVIYRCDAEGRFLFMAEGSEVLFGYAPTEVVGLRFADLTAEESLPEAIRNFDDQHREHDIVRRFRYLLRHRDGTIFPAEISSVAVWEDDRFAGVQGTVRGTSEEERLERELHASEERYRFLVENSPDVVFAADAEGQFTYLSERIEALTGYLPADLVGKHFSFVVTPESLPEAADRWDKLVADPLNQQVVELTLLGRDGQLTPAEVHSLGILDEQGRFAGIHGATRDISDRERLNRELRRQAGELAASDERAHLARELHDSVTQALFSMTLVSRSVELLLDRDADAARVQLTQLRELQREALAEMRALIFELRPGNIEQDGLTRALKTHTAALQGRIGLPVVVESSVEERLPLAVEDTLYRIAQEALHNVIKHAGARQVRVEVARSRGGVRMRIIDDGRGFDPDSVPAGHLGLAGMRARAVRIGATFTCRSAEGKGTTVEILVPAAVVDPEGGNADAVRGPAAVPSIRD